MTLTLTYDLDLQSHVSYGHDLLVQSQRSVGSEDRVETNGRTDGGDCITCHINAVSNNSERRSVRAALILPGDGRRRARRRLVYIDDMQHDVVSCRVCR